MTSQHQFKKGCFSRSVNLHTKEVCQRRQLLVLVHLVVLHVVQESLHNLLPESFSLPVCLRVVGCAAVVFGTQYSAYEIKKSWQQTAFHCQLECTGSRHTLKASTLETQR